jgi:hypothetical protein
VWGGVPRAGAGHLTLPVAVATAPLPLRLAGGEGKFARHPRAELIRAAASPNADGG